MDKINRFNFRTRTALIRASLILCLCFVFAGSIYASSPLLTSVSLSWLGNKKPIIPCGVSWGVPWSRGALLKDASVLVRDSADRVIPAQIWPLAYWPDGSVKWTGVAIAADAGNSNLTVSTGYDTNPSLLSPLKVTETLQSIEVRTGALTAVISKSGSALISSLKLSGKETARNGTLIAVREDRSEYGNKRILREEDFFSKIDRVTVEQSGPVRAVIHIEGKHANSSGFREWLPFSVRLYFTAGLNSIRMVHSFIFDGDQSIDFIKGIGLKFSIPFREELQNRHIRFSTDEGNMFAEPVLMAPGYRPRAMEKAAEYEQAQLDGRRIPNLSELPAREQTNILGTAIWDNFKINQLSADSWGLFKQTNDKSSWLHITSGRRAGGLAFIGDVSGGLAIGMKHFWQKYPAAIEINKASAQTGELKVWFWSPDTQPMDMRHYDIVGHLADVTYEDARTIPLKHADAYGCANTTELMLWVTPDTPSAVMLDAMSQTINNPPLPICLPKYYHDTQTLGIWNLPNALVAGLSKNELTSAEIQLERAFKFFSGEVERRRWYGFWDFGDYRRTYDPIRHQWMYDIGGHGWNATELMPNVWLWFAFLRTGNADLFHAAEDMTRNTSEVDVYHLGRFAGVGSRHNVSHWGDGAKEPRISEAYLKRFYYYLTTDERTGDLIREPLAVLDKTMMSLEGGKYGALLPARIGPDWQAYVSNWMTEWERTGNTKYRDYCLTGMKDLGRMTNNELISNSFLLDTVSKHLVPRGDMSPHTQFLFLFCGDQIFSELISLIDCPEFSSAWGRWCQEIIRNNRANDYFKTRLMAYVANLTGDSILEAKAVESYRGLLRFGNGDYFISQPLTIDDPTVTQPAVENPNKSSFVPTIATPEVSQWALNLMTTPVLLNQFKSK